MLGMEQILCELNGEELKEQGLPPGFRFHPTDQELITFYLASKLFHATFCGVDIAEVDLNRCEPWELPDAAKMGEREWYLYSLRDRKYPTGLRTNRATGAGYWKATGKDREVYRASNGCLVGMKKTLVFYKGRAPRGEKTKWVMHEYRLDAHFSYRHACKEEWVICRIFQKQGEKKNPMLASQAYLLDSVFPSNDPNNTGFQIPFQIHHPPENDDLNSFIMSEQPNKLLYTPSPSKSPLSYQDSTILKVHGYEDPADAPPPSYHHHPLFFEMECNSPVAAAAEVRVQQTMLHPYINIVHAHGESWPSDA